MHDSTVNAPSGTQKTLPDTKRVSSHLAVTGRFAHSHQLSEFHHKVKVIATVSRKARITHKINNGSRGWHSIIKKATCISLTAGLGLKRTRARVDGFSPGALMGAAPDTSTRRHVHNTAEVGMLGARRSGNVESKSVLRHFIARTGFHHCRVPTSRGYCMLWHAGTRPQPSLSHATPPWPSTWWAETKRLPLFLLPPPAPACLSQPPPQGLAKLDSKRVFCALRSASSPHLHHLLHEKQQSRLIQPLAELYLPLFPSSPFPPPPSPE